MSSTTTPQGDGAITGQELQFGLIFFSSSSPIHSGSETPFTEEKYRLVIESTKYADRHGFSSVWIPERHFTRDGWLYPNPAVLQAALARETSRIHLRAGSVVMPLHHPIRVAEEWAMVDNLSNGRVGLSFASGWHPNDFVFFPENYANRTEEMYRGIEMVRKLWRGESVTVRAGDGNMVEVRTYPTPVQRELPIWVTAAGNPKTFAGAGELGAHLLTHMYNQSVEELAEKINIYREARAKHGFDPATGKVSVMLHTFIAGSEEEAHRQVEAPFCTYLRSASYLLSAVATSRGQKIDMSSLSEQDIDDYMRFVFERLVSTQRVLFGSPESCLPLVRQLQAAGVNEVACQMDFGIDTDTALASMPHLTRLKDLANGESTPDPSSPISSSNGTAHYQGNGRIHSILSTPEDTSHAQTNGHISPATSTTLASLQRRCQETVALPAFYERLRARGIELGASFQGIERLFRGNGEALGQIRLPAQFEREAEAYQVHPTLLDACFQVLIAALPSELLTREDALYLPTGLRSFHLLARPGSQVWSYAKLTTDVNQGVIEGDVRIMAEDGRTLVEATGLQLFRSEPATSVAQPQKTTTSLHELKDWLYELRWEPVSLQASAEARGTWLILMDRSGVGEQLAERLAARGESSVRVYTGTGYKQLEHGHSYRVDPAKSEDLHKLLKDVTGPFRGIVYLWALDGTPFEWANASLLEADELASVGGAMHLVQALLTLEGSALPRTWLVTSGAQQVTATNALAVEQAPLWGLGRTWAMEHAELWGGLLDLDPQVSTAQKAAQLLETLLARREEDQLAWRADQVYAARMVRISDIAQETLTIQPTASYLITGGLWGLGLEVARWLAQRGARHLVLLGRTKLPERREWERVQQGSRVAQQIAGLRALEALGAEVTYAAVDVADEQQVTNFLKEYTRQGKPAIRGVLHAASVWQDAQGQSLVRPLANTTPAGLEAVLRPKVVGSWVLYRLLRSSAQDFFVTFSSAASLFGSAGQGNYAAAGAFMDALAHRMRTEGVNALSVDWGAVSEIGFGATTDGLRVHEYWESRGIQRISPAQVLATLELLIPQQRAQVGVIKLDWSLLREYYPQVTEMPLMMHFSAKGERATQAVETAPEGDLVQQLSTATLEERLPILEAYCAEQVANVLRVSTDRLDIQQPLTALGLDSLMAIELKNRIERALQIRIPIVTFLQGPSIEQFALQVLDMLQASLEKVQVSTNGTGNGHSKGREADVRALSNGSIEQDEAEQLLNQLDQLSDSEVEALLNQMLPEGNGVNGVSHEEGIRPERA